MEARVAGSARRVVVGAAGGPARPHRRAGAPRAGHGPERLARNKVAGGVRGVASLRPARAKDSKDGADSVDENMVDMSGQTGIFALPRKFIFHISIHISGDRGSAGPTRLYRGNG